MSPIKRFLVFALLLPNYGVIKHWGNRTKDKKEEEMVACLWLLRQFSSHKIWQNPNLKLSIKFYLRSCHLLKNLVRFKTLYLIFMIIFYKFFTFPTIMTVIWWLTLRERLGFLTEKSLSSTFYCPKTFLSLGSPSDVAIAIMKNAQLATNEKELFGIPINGV